MEEYGHLILSANLRRPETNYKLSKIAFAGTLITFIVVHIRTQLLQLTAQSLIRSPNPQVTSMFANCVSFQAKLFEYFKLQAERLPSVTR